MLFADAKIFSLEDEENISFSTPPLPPAQGVHIFQLQFHLI